MELETRHMNEKLMKAKKLMKVRFLFILISMGFFYMLIMTYMEAN